MDEQVTVDRRKCSDKECSDARQQWYEQDLLPKLTVRFYVGLTGAVGILAAFFLYLSKNEIRDYELTVRDRYTTLVAHQQDMARIEGKISALEISVGGHLADVRKALDRNLLAIQEIGARKR